MNTTAISRITWSPLLCAAVAVGPGCEPSVAPQPDAQREASLVTTAEQTFQLLLEDYQSGKATGPLHLELLNTWSLRILTAEHEAARGAGLDLPDPLREAIDAHRERMRAVVAAVQSLQREGNATPAEVAATRFFEIDERAWVARLEDVKQLAEDRELEVVVPDHAEAKPLAVLPTEIFVNVSRDGRYFLSDEELDAEALEELLGESSRRNPNNLRVVIRSQADAPAEDVVRVMSICQQADIDDYVFVVSEPDEE